ncbi:LOW QUALITY PROTEIN: DUF4371 domain-containing protein, partial [Cephalotus follicularis]
KKFDTHVGAHSTAHNQARRNCEALMNQKQHIQTIICRQSNRARQEYRTHLNALVDCVRFLLRQKAFRGNDESQHSKNQDNFLELLKFLGNHNEDINNVTFKEQMAEALRFVNREGCVIERFIGIVHVSSTTSLSLKMEIEALFSKYGLSLSSIRGQGYD